MKKDENVKYSKYIIVYLYIIYVMKKNVQLKKIKRKIKKNSSEQNL